MSATKIPTRHLKFERPISLDFYEELRDAGITIDELANMATADRQYTVTIKNKPTTRLGMAIAELKDMVAEMNLEEEMETWEE